MTYDEKIEYIIRNYKNKTVKEISEIEKICKYIALGYSTNQIKKIMNDKFSNKQITRIKRKETWKKISDKYF